MSKSLLAISITLFLVSLSGCGGNKILKEPQSLELQGPLAVGADSRLVAVFDWVIVRDGPGTWSKNADWDEYLLRVKNVSGKKITINSIAIFDSLETMVESSSKRKELNKRSRSASARYKDEGVTVKAGLGGGELLAVGGATGAAAVASLAGTIGVAGVVGVLAAPVLVVGGVFRGVNNSKVSREIENRSTHMPLVLNADSEVALDVFFPLSPSPLRIEFSYSDKDADYVLTIDIAEALDGLHLVRTEE